jgi:hypothetical protein
MAHMRSTLNELKHAYTDECRHSLKLLPRHVRGAQVAAARGQRGGDEARGVPLLPCARLRVGGDHDAAVCTDKSGVLDGAVLDLRCTNSNGNSNGNSGGGSGGGCSFVTPLEAMAAMMVLMYMACSHSTAPMISACWRTAAVITFKRAIACSHAGSGLHTRIRPPLHLRIQLGALVAAHTTADVFTFNTLTCEHKLDGLSQRSVGGVRQQPRDSAVERCAVETERHLVHLHPA